MESKTNANGASDQPIVMRLSRIEARNLQWKCLSMLHFMEHVEEKKGATWEEVVHFLGVGAVVCKLVSDELDKQYKRTFMYENEVVSEQVVNDYTEQEKDNLPTSNDLKSRWMRAWDFCGRQIALGPEYEAAMDIAVVLKSVRDRGMLDDPRPACVAGPISSEYLAKMGFKERAPDFWVCESCQVELKCIFPDKDPQWYVQGADIGTAGPKDQEQVEQFMKLLGLLPF
jgi:hypothetical protein